MVLQAEFYPHGGYQHQLQGYGHAQDYYSTNGYGHKEDHYAEDDYYESGSSMKMMRPNIATPQPARHSVDGHENHHSHHMGGYGKHESNYDHHSHGFSSGMHSGGKIQGFSGHGNHGYPKPSGMHHSASDMGYGRHHGSYMQMGPGRLESVNYDYYNEGHNSPPGYYEQHHMGNKHWAVKGAEPEWTSKGI